MKTLFLSLFLLVGLTVFGQSYKPVVDISCLHLKIDPPKAFGYIPNDRSEGLFNLNILGSTELCSTEQIVLGSTDHIRWHEDINAAYKVTIITDKTIKEYVDWCQKDSALVQIYEDAYYTYPDKIGVNGNLIFHPAEYVQKWEHKEPTFIGFYEWLKQK